MSFLDSITDTIKDLASSVIDTAEQYAKGFEDIGRDAAYGVGDFFKYLPDNAVGVFDVLKDEGKSLFDDLLHDVTHPGDFFSDVGSTIVNAASDAADGIKDFVEGLPGDAENLYTLANWMTGGIPDDIVHDVTHPADTISDAWDDVKGLF
jgi:hypothetical protein